MAVSIVYRLLGSLNDSQLLDPIVPCETLLLSILSVTVSATREDICSEGKR